MAHLIFECTDNLEAEGDISALLQKANRAMLDQGVFPPGGIRSRAIMLRHYCVAEGGHDDAFVHASIKIGAGRSADSVRETANAVFEVMKAHFAVLYARRTLALSLEISEFSEAGTLKHNNIHARYRK